MDIKLPNFKTQKSSASAPKARVGNPRKPARLRGLSALSLVQCGTGHRTGRPGPDFARHGAIPAPREAAVEPFHEKLGPPLDIRKVAAFIGCSPWSVRQTLIPQGLPHFRFKANGRLIFYRDQVVRWIENQQGGKTTK